jgi:hypothetical protein
MQLKEFPEWFRKNGTKNKKKALSQSTIVPDKTKEFCSMPFF